MPVEFSQWRSDTSSSGKKKERSSTRKSTGRWPVDLYKESKSVAFPLQLKKIDGEKPDIGSEKEAKD